MDNVINIEEIPVQKTQKVISFKNGLIGNILLIIILLVGLYFRFVGMNWDQNHHLHPDERFLTMVETGISPVNTLGDYFNTEFSTLNPHNAGFGFFVYGTLPIFLVRYLAEWSSLTGYDQVHLVGRFVSAFFDLFTVLLVYLITFRLYRKEKMALLAAAFSAMSVLHIQLSHYFTVDVFTNFCAFLAFYFAVCILTEKSYESKPEESHKSCLYLDENNGQDGPFAYLNWIKRDWSSAWYYILFGISLGMAVASKVSIGLIAIMLPIVAAIRYFKQNHKERKSETLIILRNLFIAAFVSFLVFRIFQPYAFSGPGFFGIKPNIKWVENLRDLSVQSNGDVDFPPALQWARLPFGFAWSNMVIFGLGIPLGLLSWIGFLWMSWRMIKGEWQQNIIVWGWTLIYFCWQSLVFNPTMRYLLPVYPTLAIIAAWTLNKFWERNKNYFLRLKNLNFTFRGDRYLAIVIGSVVLITTFLWAYAFTRIYTRPVTRVEASQWIYQNIPGAINIRIETKDGLYNQPLPFRWGERVTYEQPMIMAIKPKVSGLLTEINFAHINNTPTGDGPKSLSVVLTESINGMTPLTYGFLMDEFKIEGGDPRGKAYSIPLETKIHLEDGKTYFISVGVLEPKTELLFSGIMTVGIQTDEGKIRQSLPDPVDVIRKNNSYSSQFVALRTGEVKQIFLPRVADWEQLPGTKTLRIQILEQGTPNPILGTAEIKDSFIAQGDPRGQGYLFDFDKPISLKNNKNYLLSLDLVEGEGAIGIYGARQSNESSWDDPLPVGMEGYNPFDYFSGLYRSDLNFEMYWDENESKREKFVNILDQADYIFISSNRQWGTTVRVPERYPLTSFYYRKLLGCPDNQDIIWCYSVSDVGTFSGQLGFDLVKISQSDPNVGPIKINSQFAEEAFTVYDHPKVLIFQKRQDYDSQKVFALLNSVDLTTAIHVTPRQTKSFPANLMLPWERLIAQRAGGTWSQLFDRDFLPNRYPTLSILYWYLAISLIGWVNYPLVRFVFFGLSDKGYPLLRIVGISLTAFITWIAASKGALFSRETISISLLILLAINLFLFYIQRDSISDEWRKKWRYFLILEAAAFGLFILFLLIRLGNPDLWHPSKGGEKPMDFSYLNAVIKSSTFPPYDPWFSGGYINYYYYGFVLIGVIVKWLGIIPSVAYNLILPSFFSFLGISAFSIGWNLLGSNNEVLDSKLEENENHHSIPFHQWLGGISATTFLLLLGNLGSIRMIAQGLIRLSTSIKPDDLFFYEKWFHSVKGLLIFLSGIPLPYGIGDWYWIPSRVIPGEPITEFPFFTFLYGDLHAHLIALPITIAALSWALSIFLGKWEWGIDKEGRWHRVQYISCMVVGGVLIGSLRPINTWDIPTYLALAIVAVVFSAIMYSKNAIFQNIKFSKWIGNITIAVASTALLIFLAFGLFQPFSQWFGQAYNTISFWKGDHTPFESYFTHWGLFLFLIVSWLFHETIYWMAHTPLSALNKLKPFISIIKLACIFLVIVSFSLLIIKVKIGWLIPFLCVWLFVLLLKPGQTSQKRAVLFMTGTGLVLSLAVELIVIQGDIGRMNTVFKFYLQAWTLLSLSAAASLVWLYPTIIKIWKGVWRNLWIAGLLSLIGSAALFPMIGTVDKIRDRISNNAPHSLDGMAYMATSQYSDFGVLMDLGEDYKAIQWVQDNIKGSPVIVEANTPEYRWGSRYSIYTGLPGVLGWNWHQRQQRAISPTQWIWERVENIKNFYLSTDRYQVIEFLRKYDVSYIIVGQLEQAAYLGDGIEKFPALEGDLWNLVYHDGNTSIYQVIK